MLSSKRLLIMLLLSMTNCAAALRSSARTMSQCCTSFHGSSQMCQPDMARNHRKAKTNRDSSLMVSSDNTPEEGVTSKKTRKTRGTTSKTVQATTDSAPTEAAATETKSKTTPKKKRKKKKAEATGPLYWRDEKDKLIFTRSSSTPTLFRFTVRGNPRPLVRHRTGRGFLYNPSAPAQAEFRSVVEDLLQFVLGVPPIMSEQHIGAEAGSVKDVPLCDTLPVDPSEKQPQPTNESPASTTCYSTSSPQIPLFHADVLLVMTIIFRLRRPNIHFIGSKRGTNRLKASAPSENSPIRKDVDNLAKFVLDAMNDVLYEDDKQVASLHITKLYDDDQCCEGSTEVLLQALADDDIHSLIMNSFHPCRKQDND